MKQNRGDWTDAVRRSLGDAEPPLPRGGWERLEQELGNPAPGTSGTPLHRVWLKFAAAAAAVLVCVSIGFHFVRNGRNVLERVVMVSEAAVSEQNTGTGEQGSSVPDYLAGMREMVGLSAGPVEVVSETAVSHRRKPSALVAAAESRSDPAVESVPQTEPVAQGIREMRADSKESQPSVTDESSPEMKSETGEKRNAAEVPHYKTADYDGLFASAEPVVQLRRRGSIALVAGGVVTSAGGGPGANPASLAMISDGAAALRYAYDEFSYDHKQPLSFGLTFRKELGYGLSAESGLTYTLLRSSVAVPSGVRDVRQQLHLIGIPLRVNWEFLRRGRFSLYVGAGGMVEKCVSARFGAEPIKEKGVQWSLFGAVGAQYRLGKTVAIYFEPEISHYLTKTTLRTAYTDSSINLNLQLGLRFTY